MDAGTHRYFDTLSDKFDGVLKSDGDEG